MKWVYRLLIFFLLLFLGPAWIALTQGIDRNWKTVSRASALLAPSPESAKEAIVQVYAARTYGWRGIFAVHTWMATKENGANHYLTYQVIGWRRLNGLSVVEIMEEVPDRYWFNHAPELIAEVKGRDAEIAIEKIKKLSQEYPDSSTYRAWPGPNSNTFIAYLGRQLPELKLAMPSNAIGKDYLPEGGFFARAPSGTGYQITFWGLLGILIAEEEGIEINVLGLVFGFDPHGLALKIPGIGRLALHGKETQK